MKRIHNRTGGFTIIEVVLVLAVAGLIFLVVFAAIPRLQASRRDNQRKRDAEAIWAIIIEYESNTDSLPAQTTGGFNDAFPAAPTAPSGAVYTGYFENENLEDPGTGRYVHLMSAAADFTPGQFRYQPGTWGVCNSTSDGLQSTGGAGKYAILMKLERGYYCLDNS